MPVDISYIFWWLLFPSELDWSSGYVIGHIAIKLNRPSTARQIDRFPHNLLFLNGTMECFKYRMTQAISQSTWPKQGENMKKISEDTKQLNIMKTQSWTFEAKHIWSQISELIMSNSRLVVADCILSSWNSNEVLNIILSPIPCLYFLFADSFVDQFQWWALHLNISGTTALTR